MSVAPLSITIEMNDPSETKGASDSSAAIAMNAPKHPLGKRWSCVGVSEEADLGAAGLASDAAGGVPAAAEDEATSAKEGPRALKGNPNVVGSG